MEVCITIIYELINGTKDNTIYEDLEYAKFDQNNDLNNPDKNKPWDNVELVNNIKRR